MDDFITMGYEVVEGGLRTKMLRKKTWGSAGGHVLVAILTFWWSFGLGNLVYAFIAHSSAEKVMMKLVEGT